VAKKIEFYSVGYNVLENLRHARVYMSSFIIFRRGNPERPATKSKAAMKKLNRKPAEIKENIQHYHKL